MLSDALHAMRERLSAGAIDVDPHSFVLALRAWEIEARNMESRIEALCGRPHVVLHGALLADDVGGLGE
ncbi:MULTISPECIES: hypothetical protein [unclassified Ensifer]|uniref:hypothetical protein n=1 Tax=unclassified Ensifer TaxID=2633371 RepID=UPI0008134ED7|nr:MULTISPECIES: hypothetical protein [unclassified Ensifer]OCP17395.1 hypothetical protein BC361_08015 [Ensifer sp. LC54]OCP28699.1 hypothetical protein BC363_02340 [Ensifer sp. LC384]